MAGVVQKLMKAGGMRKTADGEPTKGQPRNDNKKPSPSDQAPKGVQSDNNDPGEKKEIKSFGKAQSRQAASKGRKHPKSGLKTYANQVK